MGQVKPLSLPAVREELEELRLNLVEASEQNDWQLVQEIDDDIRLLLTGIEPSVRNESLVKELAVLKETYLSVFEASDARKLALKQQMEELRAKRSALKGYKNTLIAAQKGQV